MGGLIHTYHLPPNFSIGPAPSGPIDLGTILNNLRDVEVLNEDCRVTIPQGQLYCHHKRGFTATRSRMRKGEFGVWAGGGAASTLGLKTWLGIRQIEFGWSRQSTEARHSVSAASGVGGKV